MSKEFERAIPLEGKNVEKKFGRKKISNGAKKDKEISFEKLRDRSTTWADGIKVKSSSSSSSSRSNSNSSSNRRRRRRKNNGGHG